MSGSREVCATAFFGTIFLRSNKIEILNVAGPRGPRESKEPGVYGWTLTMLRLFLNRAVIRRETSREYVRQNWRVGGCFTHA